LLVDYLTAKSYKLAFKPACLVSLAAAAAAEVFAESMCRYCEDAFFGACVCVRSFVLFFHVFHPGHQIRHQWRSGNGARGC
jgi:hypothetical protein